MPGRGMIPGSPREMTPLKRAFEPILDYDEVGLKVGLEVHQQLLTEQKLFCKCPAGLYTRNHDGSVLRHMRPTLSELGEYDGTALMEFKTKKNIIYLLNKDNTCTYEMDDTPPFLVNQNALDVAIEQCLMLDCDIIDEVHIARKQYLDGSIPTGFQRTAIVGVGGKIPFRGREISITQVSVEEDSCREVSDKGHLVIWRTDRLGMPLIETVTGPELKTPEEVEEAILLVGRVCRSTRHVRVGMGASRQDVNVSVAGGRRVEIKGVPFAWWAPRLVHGEAWRQVNLLRLRDELHKRGFNTPADLKIDSVDITDFFADGVLPFLREERWRRFLEKNEYRDGFELGKGDFSVRAIRLQNLYGTLNWPTQPELTFSDELRGRIRVISGLDQPPILIHSEKWPDYDGSPRELKALRKYLGVRESDSFLVVWGPAEDAIQAVEEVRLRYADALDGVPNETRQPLPDGSTDFERILPGPDRMYPDTDSPPTKVTRERVDDLESALPATPWEREALYSKVGVPQPVIFYLIRRGGAHLVDLVVREAGADLRQACFFFGEKIKGLRRKGVDVDSIGEERWIEFFQAVVRNPVLFDNWVAIVRAFAGDPGTPIDLSVAPTDWAQSLTSMQNGFRERKRHKPEKRLQFALGRALETLRGYVAVQDVRKALEGANP